MAWHFDDKGFFSVKSAYHVLADKRVSKLEKQQGASSSGTATTGFKWLRIWSLPYAPKVKQFLWRMAHDSLPLGLNIREGGGGGGQ